jgi:hypothetical protein
VGRWLSPFGLALALACLWLPFLMGSPRPAPANPLAATGPSITYTGSDLAFGGTAQVLVAELSEDLSSYELRPISDEMMYGHPQQELPGSAYGLLAVALIWVGILASLTPAARIRNVASAAAALLGSLAILAMEVAQRREVAKMLTPLLNFPPNEPGLRDFVSPRYGFWIMMALLIGIGFAHVSAAVPRTAPRDAAVAGRE